MSQAKNLKAFRELLGITQQELAKESGIPRSSISFYERYHPTKKGHAHIGRRISVINAIKLRKVGERLLKKPYKIDFFLGE